MWLVRVGQQPQLRARNYWRTSRVSACRHLQQTPFEEASQKLVLQKRWHSSTCFRKCHFPFGLCWEGVLWDFHSSDWVNIHAGWKTQEPRQVALPGRRSLSGSNDSLDPFPDIFQHSSGEAGLWGFVLRPSHCWRVGLHLGAEHLWAAGTRRLESGDRCGPIEGKVW